MPLHGIYKYVKIVLDAGHVSWCTTITREEYRRVREIYRGTMGTKRIIAIGLALIAANAQASTNKWSYGGSDYWDIDSRWSLGSAPSISDNADFITNAISKTVTVDDTDTSFFPNELTVSNLTVFGTGSTTNVLSLADMNNGALIPLEIVNGFNVGAQGVLQITNSMLTVVGTLSINGSAQIYDFATVLAGNAAVGNGAVLQFALGTNSGPVVVTNALTVGGTVNIIDGGGFTTNTYTLFTYGGAFVNNGLTLGTTPTNTSGFLSFSTAGQVNLVVTQAMSSVSSSGTFQIVSIVRNTNDIMIAWKPSGLTNWVQAVNGGTNGYSTNTFQDISGPIPVGGSTITNYVDVGGATNGASRFYRVRH